MKRRKLEIRRDLNEGDHHQLKRIIEKNASLRIDFGWSFESETHYKTIMKECIETVAPYYNSSVAKMMADLTCSWLGFVPHNSYDKEVYKDLSTYGLIIYNNELVNFQINVVTFIIEHRLYKQHAMLRDEWYRFEFFKNVRKDKVALEAAYHGYIDCIKDICMLKAIPRDLLETQIGCHFLYESDLFFELLEFSILKGEIYE
jgi:hypothetical protein